VATDDAIDPPATFRLTAHARAVMASRRIDLAWIEATVANPEATEPDPYDPDVVRLFRRVAARGDRWLRVVVSRQTSPPLVVTAFFDRGRSR
jgi:hypothetical protein